MGSQLRSKPYRVKRCECYTIPHHTFHLGHSQASRVSDDDSSDDEATPMDNSGHPPSLPQLPTELVTPAHETHPLVSRYPTRHGVAPGHLADYVLD